MMYLRNFLIASVLIIGIGVGCSGGGGDALAPDVRRPDSDYYASTGNTGLWGLWDVSIDAESGDVELVPLRGVEFTCNVVRFLQPPIVPQNLLTFALVSGSDLTTGHIIADVSLRHPFPGLEKFSGFDVRAAVIGDGFINGIADSGILYGGEGSIELKNADGMTRWFNPSEFTSYGTVLGFIEGARGFPGTDYSATLNPYKYYCDTLDPLADINAFFADPACLNPRGLFGVTSTNTRRFDLQFPLDAGSPRYRFQYAVLASWEPPVIVPPENIPDDFPISANCAEAYAISVTDESDMFYNDPNSKGGTMRLRIRVFDHQMQLTSVLDEIRAVHFETPDGLITTGGLASFDQADLAAALVDQDEKSATFLLEVPEVDPPGQGEFPVLVAVESADWDSYFQGIPGFAFPDGALAAYLLTSVSIGPGIQGENPVAIAEVVTPPPYCPDDPIEFDASASYDPDGGSIVNFEWDFDNDGVYGDPFNGGTEINPTIILTSSGSYTIDLRVTDDEAATDTLDDPIVISVGGPTWVDDDAVPPCDGSFENPWPTIQEGIDNATDECGQKWVLVKDGVYEEEIQVVSDIIVEGWSDPAPLILGPESSSTTLVEFGSSSGSTIKHFMMQPRTSEYGIHFTGSNITIEDIEFIDNPGGETCKWAVYGGGWSSSGNVIDGVRCDGYHVSQGGTTGFMRVSGGSTTVTGCVCINVAFTNVDSGYGPYVLLFSDGDSDSLYARNVVGDIDMSGPDGVHPRVRAIYVDGSEGATVRNNLVFNFDNNSNGGWTAGIYIDDAEGMTVEHNTVYGISGLRWIYALHVGDINGDPSGVTHRDHIVSNLITDTMNWRWAYLGSWDDAFELPVDYSCAYNVGNAFRDLDQVVEGVGFIEENPQFLDPSGLDFRIAPGSPCSGTAHDGTDMGAYGGSDPLTWLPG